MNKNEIIEKLQVPGLFMGDYLEAFNGLKRSELIEIANEVDVTVRNYYSNLEIKKAIVNVFMLPRCSRAYAEMGKAVKFTLDDVPNRF
jgi:hypothetical protein